MNTGRFKYVYKCYQLNFPCNIIKYILYYFIMDYIELTGHISIHDPFSLIMQQLVWQFC